MNKKPKTFIYMCMYIAIFLAIFQFKANANTPIFWTSNVDSSYLFQMKEITDLDIYKIKSNYSGISKTLKEEIEKESYSQIEIHPSLNYKEALKKVLFYGNGHIENDYSDLFIGLFFDKKNLEKIQYIFPPFFQDEIVMVQRNTQIIFTAEQFLKYIRNKKIFVAEGLCIECIFPEIEKKGKYYKYKGHKLRIETKLNLDESIKILLKYDKSVLIINKARYNFYYQNTPLKFSQINRDNKNISIPIFVGINKMSPIIKNNKLKFIGAIKRAIKNLQSYNE